MLRQHLGWRTAGISLVSVCALVLLCGSAIATDTPDMGAAITTAPTESEANTAPESPDGLIQVLSEESNPELTLIIPRDAADRGLSSFTGHLDRAYPGKNTYEQTKLALARTAIEASRAAGTLLMSYQGPPLPERPEDIDNMKLQALRYAEPANLEQFPAAGIDSELRPVQEFGPSGLSAEELQRCKDLGEEVGR